MNKNQPIDSLDDFIVKVKSHDNGIERDFDIDSQDLKAQEKLLGLQLDRYKRNTFDRKWLAIWTAIIVSVWLFFVLFILIFNAPFRFGISDTVLIALLGTTTLNVLGLSFIVLRGHFQAKESE